MASPPEETVSPVKVQTSLIINTAFVITIFPGILAVPFNVTAALLVIPPSKVAFASVVNEPVTKLLPARVIATLLEKTNEECPLAPKANPLTRVNVSPVNVNITPTVLFHVTGVVNIKFPIVPLAAILKIDVRPPELVTVTLGILVVPGIKVIFPDPPSSKLAEPN